MKQLFLLIPLVLIFSSCDENETTTIRSDDDKAIYAAGYRYGEQLKSEGLTNIDLMKEGMTEGFSGSPSRLAPAEMERALTLRYQARQAQVKNIVAERSRENSTFLAANLKQGFKITPTGLEYMMIKDGTGRPPRADSTVQVKYKTTLPKGLVVDSSDGQPSAVRSLKVSDVVRGLQESLMLMKPGAHGIFAIPPQLAYGDRGSEKIPPNSVLVYDIELISVK